MKPKYLKYNLEDLLEDKIFISWVLHGSREEEWNQFLKQHPYFKVKAEKAIKVIDLLMDTHENLDDELILELWQRIKQFNQQNKIERGRVYVWKRVRWAASILIILSLGILGYLYIQNSDYYLFAQESANNVNEAQVLFSTGDKIALNRKNSSIALTEENNRVIVNDSLIKLSEKPERKEAAMNELVVPYGKKSELILNDGTKVWLNAGSKLAFPSEFSGQTRAVFLEGEAYFKVANNESKPFIVNTGKLDVEVLGTWFNISAYPSDERIETVLLEGSVAINKRGAFGVGKSQVVLKPSQKASFNKSNRDFMITEESNADIYIAWTEGCLQFHKESLYEVFTKLERYYNVEIELPKHFPSSEQITGKLDLKESMEEVMIVLSDVAKIEYRISGDKIYIDKQLKKHFN